MSVCEYRLSAANAATVAGRIVVVDHLQKLFVREPKDANLGRLFVVGAVHVWSKEIRGDVATSIAIFADFVSGLAPLLKASAPFLNEEGML
jgi:hypothetical protein